MNTTSRTVGQVVIDALRAQGIRRAFCVPGESYLGILEAVRELGDGFDLVVCRHEGGAAYMAEASARMDGLPGVCMVTRGPGACNASIGIHTARHEGTPLLLLVGDVTAGSKSQAAFQDIDLPGFYGSMAKQVFQVDHAASVETVMRQAFRVAISGKPGPVVIAFPEDVQFESVTPRGILPETLQPIAPAASLVSQVLARLRAAKAPLLLLGGSQWPEAARRDVADFAQAMQLPVASTFRRLELFDNESPCYVGSIGVVTPPALAGYLEQADVIMLLGGQLGEIETARYSRLTSVSEQLFFVQVGPQIESLGLALQPNLAITSDMPCFCAALASAPALAAPSWAGTTRELRAAFEQFRQPVQFAGKVNPAQAVMALSQSLPGGMVCSLGGGNYTHFVLRHHRFRPGDVLLAPICAPMGYSVPAAIAAAIADPQREVLAYAGDGCFLMNAQELVTAVQRKLRLSIVILNNGIYGAIRMHQELKYPGRPIATALHNPDFIKYAEAMGLPARRVEDHGQLVATWHALRASTDGPFLIELITDPDIISPAKLIAAATAVPSRS